MTRHDTSPAFVRSAGNASFKACTWKWNEVELSAVVSLLLLALIGIRLILGHYWKAAFNPENGHPKFIMPHDNGFIPCSTSGWIQDHDFSHYGSFCFAVKLTSDIPITVFVFLLVAGLELNNIHSHVATLFCFIKAAFFLRGS